MSSVVVGDKGNGPGGAGGGAAARVAGLAASRHVPSGDSAGVCELFAMAAALASATTERASRGGTVAISAEVAAAQYDCRAHRIACAELGSRLAVVDGGGGGGGGGEGGGGLGAGARARQTYAYERRRWLHLARQLLAWSPTGTGSTSSSSPSSPPSLAALLSPSASTSSSSSPALIASSHLRMALKGIVILAHGMHYVAERTFTMALEAFASAEVLPLMPLAEAMGIAMEREARR